MLFLNRYKSMCSFICRKELHGFLSASVGFEDGMLCSGSQDLCALSVASFSEEITVLQDPVLFPSSRERLGRQVLIWSREKEGTVLSYRMLDSFIRQQVHWSETWILHEKLRLKLSFVLFLNMGRNTVATGELLHADDNCNIILQTCDKKNIVYLPYNKYIHMHSSCGFRFFQYAVDLDDLLCGLVVRVSGYRYRGSGFDSRCYQIFWVVVGLERGPLTLVSLMRSIEELLERKSSGSRSRKQRKRPWGPVALTTWHRNETR
jgi:hypothetical protein